MRRRTYLAVAIASAVFIAGSAFVPIPRLNKPVVSIAEATNVFEFFTDKAALKDYREAHNGRVSFQMSPPIVLGNDLYTGAIRSGLEASSPCGLSLALGPDGHDATAKVVTIIGNTWTDQSLRAVLSQAVPPSSLESLIAYSEQGIIVSGSVQITLHNQGGPYKFTQLWLLEGDVDDPAKLPIRRLIFQNFKGGFGVSNPRYQSQNRGLFEYFIGAGAKPSGVADELFPLGPQICRADALISFACGSRSLDDDVQLNDFRQGLQAISDQCESRVLD